jgi:hypothetical protein
MQGRVHEERSALNSTMPRLPPGSTAQPVRTFHDPTGRLTYELNLVYGPTRLLLRRRGIEGQLLDEDQSYWIVTWAGAAGTEDEHACARWITFAQARELHVPRLTFARFSTLEDMRAVLPDLLKRRPSSRDATAIMDVAVPTGASVRPAQS